MASSNNNTNNSRRLADVVQNIAASKLFALLEKIDGSKDLVISKHILVFLDFICGYKFLRNAGVEKIYTLNSKPTATNKKICFIIPSYIGDVKEVCSWFHSFYGNNINDIQYWIIFITKFSFECERYLEIEGFFNSITIWECIMGFIPLNADLYSMELHLYPHFTYLKDYQFLNNTAEAIHQFQKYIGQINLIISKGRTADLICEHLQRMNLFSGFSESKITKNLIFDLFVFDREEDYVSMLLSQMNYVGIIDETFTISAGKIEFNPDPGSTKHNLFKNDPLFSELQNSFFSSVCSILKKKGQMLQQKSLENKQMMNLSEMKNFLKDYKNLQSEHQLLLTHLTLCEKILEKKKTCKFSEQLVIEKNMIQGIESKAAFNFIEEGITKLLPENQMLRLICLYSICYSGISSKELSHLMKIFFQSYGHKHIKTFYLMKKSGILYENSLPYNLLSSSSTPNSLHSPPSENIKKFRHIAKKSNLIPLLENENYNPRTPTDCGYVFGGSYLPYICKLIKNYFELKSMGQVEEWCKQNHCKMQTSLTPNPYVGRDVESKTKIQIVLFVGGVTYAEISALRFLSKNTKQLIMIMTTSILNGNSFFDSFVQNLLY